MKSAHERAAAFAALHARPGHFLLPNPWDIGSARLLAGLGFEALATTSAGFATSLGTSDYHITREQKLAHIRALAASVDIPLTADLENGFGDAPETVAETIRLGAEAGLAGGSIEDSRRGGPSPLYDIAFAKERIVAAAEVKRALGRPFVLTARAENFFAGVLDLADTIRRLQAYQEAGADVLYAPGLKSLSDIKSVLAAIDRPLNVLLGPREGLVPVDELAALGVKRISLGGVLASAAYGALIEAAREFKEHGTFGFMARTSKHVADLMAEGTPK